jgi:hypothetical protein
MNNENKDVRIAVCLHGLCTGENDKGDQVSFSESYKLLKKNIIESNHNVDIFIHSWSNDDGLIKNIIDAYQPKGVYFEKQILFDDENTKLHSVKSRWYSFKECIKLKTDYEKENNFTYDYVLTTRFDLCFLTPIVFDKKIHRGFYAAKWEDSWDNDWGFQKYGLLELWLFSDSENMNKFSSMYYCLDKYLNDGVELSSHVLTRHHLLELRLGHQLRLINKEFADFCLERQLPELERKRIEWGL